MKKADYIRNKIKKCLSYFILLRRIAWLMMNFLFNVGGNPLTVMANQISMELHKIRQKCPLYETHGKSVWTTPYLYLSLESRHFPQLSWFVFHRTISQLFKNSATVSFQISVASTVFMCSVSKKLLFAWADLGDSYLIFSKMAVQEIYMP